MSDPGISKSQGRLGDYEIIQEIGRGGMGTVYEAWQVSLKRRVALKVLSRGLALASPALARFRREAEAAGMLHHTNIVPIYTIGEDRGTHFYAMELIEGPSLKQIIQYLRRQQLRSGISNPIDSSGDQLDPADIPAWAQATMTYCSGSSTTAAPEVASDTTLGTGAKYFQTVAEMAADVAAALEHAHRRGVIHRDVKPSNLLLSPDQRLSLSDFGLARILDQPGVTITGEFVGTPLYMSPEQIAVGRVPVDHRTDIYSLGATLYELLTLEPPHAGESREQIMAQILQKDVRPARRRNRQIPVDLETICMKALEKDPDRRYQTAGELEDDLRRYVGGYLIKARRPNIGRRVLRLARKHKATVAGSLTIVMLVAVLAFVCRNWYRERRLTEALASLARIEELIGADRTVAAFTLAQEASDVIPQDPRLADIWERIAVTASIETEPPGATVKAFDWRFPRDESLALGTTPLTEVRLPRGMIRWQFDKAGHVRVDRLTDLEREVGTNVGYRDRPALAVQLDAFGSIPDGMVRVLSLEGRNQRESKSDSFFIDRFEVTNREYYQFIQAGGYENPKFWQHLIEEVGEPNWKKEVDSFVDMTGLPGPSTWSGGMYPADEASYPVRGVSWYEAAAYAASVEKVLPTHGDWRRAATPNYATWIIPLSNFDQRQVVEGGSYPGIGYFGIYDMAGNVKEWCWNATDDGRRCALGGAWNEPTYFFTHRDAAFPMERSARFGFRCARYETPPPPEAFEPVRRFFGRDYAKAIPASEAEIDSYRRLYLYDKEQPLDPKCLSRGNSPNGHTYEIWEVSSACGDKSERLPLHLLLPNGKRPPFPVSIFFPGVGALRDEKLADIRRRCDWVVFETFVDHGLAMCWPIYKGTLDRVDGRNPFGSTVRSRDSFIDMAKDLFRAIDYLETREDIDKTTISYVGFSWGGCHGPVISVLEPRLKALLLLSAGLPGSQFSPEVDPFNYLPLTTAPVLVLNGIYDLTFPLNESQLPFFESLGSTDKERKPYESSHFVPLDQAVPYATDWLEKHLLHARKLDL